MIYSECITQYPHAILHVISLNKNNFVLRSTQNSFLVLTTSQQLTYNRCIITLLTKRLKMRYIMLLTASSTQNRKSQNLVRYVTFSRFGSYMGLWRRSLATKLNTSMSNLSYHIQHGIFHLHLSEVLTNHWRKKKKEREENRKSINGSMDQSIK